MGMLNYSFQGEIEVIASGSFHYPERSMMHNEQIGIRGATHFSFGCDTLAHIPNDFENC